MKPFIEELKNRVISGGEISFEEASRLIGIELNDTENLNTLLDAAREITFHFNSDWRSFNRWLYIFNAQLELCRRRSSRLCSKVL